jgi:uncharacterized protein with NAD-binding domain and iron-sulfur cluster
MSINCTATISFNHASSPPLKKSHFIPEMAGEFYKDKHNFHGSNSLTHANKHSGIIKYAMA